MISISSARLQLIPLDQSMLKTWQGFGRQSLENALQLKPNVLQVEKFYAQEMDDALVNFWLPMTHKFPLDFMWYTNWEIILMDSSCSIGGIGLSGLPDNQGTTEIGYVIDQKFRGKGYATEAVEALMHWAFQDTDLQIIRAETPKDNLASQRVLEVNQFKQTGEKTIQCPNPIEVFTWERYR